MSQLEVKVPDIGDFKEVEVIEVLVKPGDTVKLDQSLITVESDKASMEIPATAAGVLKELKVKLGDKVSEGSVLAILEGSGEAAAPAPAAAPAAAAAAPAPQRTWEPPAATAVHQQIRTEEPIGATVDPSSHHDDEHPVHEAFWFAVAQHRTAFDPGTGSPAFVIEPGGWVLALEDRGHEFLVQHTDGRLGVLRDLSNIERG